MKRLENRRFVIYFNYKVRVEKLQKSREMRNSKRSDNFLTLYKLSNPISGIDGLKKEYDKMGAPKPLASRAFSDNTTKNRYDNIPCYDHTRVILKYGVPPESDYIHANHVRTKIAELKNDFICTQVRFLS